MNRVWTRWVPAAAVPAVIAAGILVGSIPARAGDPLPQKTPAEVIALLGQHNTRTFSGTVEQTSDLGLPALPAAGPTAGPAAGGASGPGSAGGTASMIELLSGAHTARIFTDGPAKMRVQVLDRLAERDVIRRDNELWFYNSKDNTAAHLRLPALANVPAVSGPAPAPDTPGPTDPDGRTPVPPTPGDLAAKFLAAAGSSTAVTVGPEVQVAGRPAYSLELMPRTDGTLLEKVAIAVDGQTGMALRVTVSARGQVKPAFQAGFTSLSLEAPEDGLFNFVAPPGATVKELQTPPVPARPGAATPGMVSPRHTPGDAPAQRRHDGPRPTVTGTGWETVIGFPAAPEGQGAQLDQALLKDPLLSQAAAVVPGGRLLSTPLVNVLLTDDGRIFAGMVPADRLQAAAGTA